MGQEVEPILRLVEHIKSAHNKIFAIVKSVNNTAQFSFLRWGRLQCNGQSFISHFEPN